MPIIIIISTRIAKQYKQQLVKNFIGHFLVVNRFRYEYKMPSSGISSFFSFWRTILFVNLWGG